jgi:hypothetical protein
MGRAAPGEPAGLAARLAAGTIAARRDLVDARTGAFQMLVVQAAAVTAWRTRPT